jgi:hypothetical protein
MTEKQTRRSVHLKEEFFYRVRRYCEKHEMSMSSFIEERIAEFFEEPVGDKNTSPELLDFSEINYKQIKF